VVVLGEVIEPGVRRDMWIPLGHRPDGSPLGIPLVVINGAKPGKQLSLIAGVHGDEFENCEGLRRFVNALDPADVSGVIIATPQANAGAFDGASRHSVVDHLDLNRQFPGDESGFLTQRIGAALVNTFVPFADLLLDMHSGGMVLGLEPFVGFDPTPGAVGEASLELAKSAGIPMLYGSVPFANVLRLAAAQQGVASVLVEIGSEGRLREELVDMSVETLTRVAAHYGIVDTATPFAPMEQFTLLVAHESGEFLHAATGGFLTHRVALGDEVTRGQILGAVTDPFGTVLDEIVAPHDGVIAELRTVPVLHTGDWTYAVIPSRGTFAGTATLEDLEIVR